MGSNEGFDPIFLGEEFPISFPCLREDISQITLERAKIYAFTHFLIVMNKERKFAFYGVNNTDVEKTYSWIDVITGTWMRGLRIKIR
ncbi:hypothetical protein M9428_01755 (plasmid) [Bacillus bombysepticus]